MSSTTSDNSRIRIACQANLTGAASHLGRSMDLAFVSISLAVKSFSSCPVHLPTQASKRDVQHFRRWLSRVTLPEQTDCEICARLLTALWASRLSLQRRFDLGTADQVKRLSLCAVHKRLLAQAFPVDEDLSPPRYDRIYKKFTSYGIVSLEGDCGTDAGRQCLLQNIRDPGPS